MYRLYSPRQVSVAAFVGGPLAAAWLMAINFRRLGAPRKAITLVALTTLATLGLIWLAVRVDDVPHGVNILAPLAMVVLNRGLQLEDYHSHIAREGRSGSSWRAFGVIVGALVVTVALTMPFIGQLWRPSITDGKCQVMYSDGATVEEAHATCKELVELQVINDHRATVVISRPHGHPVVEFVVGDEFRTKPEVVHVFHRLTDPLSTTVFHGEHVDVYLDNDSLEPKVKLVWEARPSGEH